MMSLEPNNTPNAKPKLNDNKLNKMPVTEQTCKEIVERMVKEAEGILKGSTKRLNIT